MKSVIWCALVGQWNKPLKVDGGIDRNAIESDSLENILAPSLALSLPLMDFLGPEIDTGFRVAEYTQRLRLTVSADLAMILCLEANRLINLPDKGATRYQPRNVVENMKIVTLKQMKGVWGGRYYPVIWYERDWGSIIRSFEYDEHFGEGLTDNIKRENASPLGANGELLKQIYDDRNANARISKIWQKLCNGQVSQMDYKAPNPLNVEVYGVAICSREDGQILIVKQDANDPEGPNLWGFGGGRIMPGEDLETCLRRVYRTRFNAELLFDGKIKNVLYICLDENKTGNGKQMILICAVRITINDKNPKKRDGGSEYKLCSVTDARKIKVKNRVSYFNNALTIIENRT